MTKIEFKNFVEKFLTDYPESSIAEISWEVYATDKKQSHDRCMSKVIAIVYDLVDKNKISQNFNSTIPVFSIIRSTK